MSNLSLDSYRLLGRSGLRVSPLSLGAMTFGSEWGWGADAQETRRIFDHYVDRGGNFIDTANFYTNGTSERLVGEFAKEKREQLVLATKYSLNTRAGDPNAGGNHRKNMVRSVEASLERLGTDHIDLFYLHAWDGMTPVEEIMRAMDDLVRAGKIIYVGISDTPAWQVSRMQAIADLRGWSPLVALQIEYNLVERTGERDLVPMAKEMGLGVIPWSPLAGGVLTGKYSQRGKNNAKDSEGSRGEMIASIGAINERSLGIADVVVSIAKEMNKSPSQVALAWTLLDSTVTSPIVGARKLSQLEENLGALDIEFSDEQRAKLAEVSAIELGFPHSFLARPFIQQNLSGGSKIARR